MKEVHYWITEDGEKFDDENSAYRHEELLHSQKVAEDVICLDFDCHSIGLMSLGSVYYLNLRTQEAATWWKNYNNAKGYATDGIESPGMYYYNEQTYEWEFLEEAISRLSNAKKELERG